MIPSDYPPALLGDDEFTITLHWFSWWLTTLFASTLLRLVSALSGDVIPSRWKSCRWYWRHDTVRAYSTTYRLACYELYQRRWTTSNLSEFLLVPLVWFWRYEITEKFGLASHDFAGVFSFFLSRVCFFCSAFGQDSSISTRPFDNGKALLIPFLPVVCFLLFVLFGSSSLISTLAACPVRLVNSEKMEFLHTPNYLLFGKS